MKIKALIEDSERIDSEYERNDLNSSIVSIYCVERLSKRRLTIILMISLPNI